MIIYCRIKEDFEQKMANNYNNILEKNPSLDPYSQYWAQYDGLKAVGNFQVSIVNSYGEVLLKCTKEQFKDLFDFEPTKELA